MGEMIPYRHRKTREMRYYRADQPVGREWVRIDADPALRKLPIGDPTRMDVSENRRLLRLCVRRIATFLDNDECSDVVLHSDLGRLIELAEKVRDDLEKWAGN